MRENETRRTAAGGGASIRQALRGLAAAVRRNRWGIALVAMFLCAVSVASVLFELRELRPTPAPSGGAEADPGLGEALSWSLLHSALVRAAAVLAFAGLLPAAVMLFGGPRRWTFRIALATWIAGSAFLIAMQWIRPPV